MELVLKVSEPVADWLPIVLLFEVTLPLAIYIAMNGDDVLVPNEVTPVKLTDAMVLLLIFETVPAVIPAKEMPRNDPVEPVIA